LFCILDKAKKLVYVFDIMCFAKIKYVLIRFLPEMFI
jgi:hypothetical protein